MIHHHQIRRRDRRRVVQWNPRHLERGGAFVPTDVDGAHDVGIRRVPGNRNVGIDRDGQQPGRVDPRVRPAARGRPIEVVAREIRLGVIRPREVERVALVAGTIAHGQSGGRRRREIVDRRQAHLGRGLALVPVGVERPHHVEVRDAGRQSGVGVGRGCEEGRRDAGVGSAGRRGTVGVVAREIRLGVRRPREDQPVSLVRRAIGHGHAGRGRRGDVIDRNRRRLVRIPTDVVARVHRPHDVEVGRAGRHTAVGVRRGREGQRRDLRVRASRRGRTGDVVASQIGLGVGRPREVDGGALVGRMVDGREITRR